MRDAISFAERLAPDTIIRLERAAQHRYESANILWKEKRRLAALYLFGYTAEICLTIAYFRNAGFRQNDPIDRETRNRRMAQARQLNLMSSDPHPILGWARFLQRQHSAGDLTDQDQQNLREAVNKAALIYSYWRPELRYKVVDIDDEKVGLVQKAVKWLLDNQPHL